MHAWSCMGGVKRTCRAAAARGSKRLYSTTCGEARLEFGAQSGLLHHSDLRASVAPGSGRKRTHPQAAAARCRRHGVDACLTLVAPRHVVDGSGCICCSLRLCGFACGALEALLYCEVAVCNVHRLGMQPRVR